MKIEDLTLKQVKEICKKYRHGMICNANCPILIECFMECPCKWNDVDLKREVKPNE